MTNEELDRLEALANAATPGPWLGDDAVNGRHGAPRVWDAQNYDDLASFTEYHGLGGENAAYVAAASPDVVLRLVAELREARATIARVAAKLGVDFGGAQSSKPLEDSIDEMIDSEGELAASRAEIGRLRAMVPSEDVIMEIRYACGCTDYRPKDALAWLARIESAKGAGR